MKTKSTDIFSAARALVKLLDAKEAAHEKCKVTTPSGEEALSTTQECFSLGIDLADAKWDLITVCDRYANHK